LDGMGLGAAAAAVDPPGLTYGGGSGGGAGRFGATSTPKAPSAFDALQGAQAGLGLGGGGLMGITERAGDGSGGGGGFQMFQNGNVTGLGAGFGAQQGTGQGSFF
jgi:hypothetical protein